MKAVIQNVFALFLITQMINAPAAFASEEKIPENITQEVVEAEKQQPEQEKTEEGEASGNVEDCEQLAESGDVQDAVDNRNLDACEAMLK